MLEACGARVHLAHPLGVKGWATRRVKNDRLDAAGLADLLRMKRLPEAWIAPPHLRQLRELVRYRAKLVALRSGLKSQVHAVLAKEGVAVPMSDLFGKAGLQLLDDLRLATAYRMRVDSLLELIDAYDHEVYFFSDAIAARLRHHPGYQVIQQIPGVGPTFAAIFVAEIGDVHRFARPGQLACWAGLTPRHRESDSTVHRGAITKQGSRLVRWAAVEAVQRLPHDVKLRAAATASPSGAAARSARSPPPAGCSPTSTTGCATATSARSPRPHEPSTTQPQRALAECHDPHHGAVADLIEPASAAAPNSSMPPRRAKG